jgi:hypothetical protein
LPSTAGLAIGCQHIVVETQLDRFFRVFERRAAASDDFAAVPDFRAIQHLAGEHGGFVIFGLRDAMRIKPGQIAFDRSVFRGHCTFSSI